MERFLEDIELGLHEERGFSTVGVALALLITLALIFSAAQVYSIASTSADIQEVADAAALAAENTVGEYCVVATLCDAVILSLSLTSLCALGLGIAAACTPLTAAASETLLNAAHKLKEARDSFAQKANDALEKFKSVLPLVAAARAAQVIDANSNMRNGAAYTGIAVLVPWQTDALENQNYDKSDQAFDDVDENEEELAKLGDEAEKAAQEASKLKQEAYRYDCGSETSYCMYERAKKLAHLSGSDNPYYSSAETWDFDVALKRAQTYYQTRKLIESPENNSVAERARSSLRKHFYKFADEELSHGYVKRSADSFDAYFPLLPKNTAEMKATKLYTDVRYPISTASEGKRIMHAFEDCPVYTSNTKAGFGSIKQMDGNSNFETCPSCEFSPSSMGSVAAASSTIDNGFEFHYRKVAELARDYTEVHKDLDNKSSALKDLAEKLFDAIGSAFDQVAGQRIKINPPGKFGAIAFVITTDPGNTTIASRFVNSSGDLSTRAALSGATLVAESTESGKTAINSLLDGIANTNGSSAIGPAKVMLDLWSGLLKGYGQGQEALSSGLKEAINAIPFASESGLGRWAAESFQSLISHAGLEAADLSPQKAALVNTAHIAKADDSTFSARLTSVKESVLSHPDADELFTTAIGGAKDAIVGSIEDAEFTINIATIEIMQGGVSIPLTITLPQTIKDKATNVVESAFARLQQAYESIVPARRWQ